MKNKKIECVALEETTAPIVNFGTVFGDHDAVCDYTPCLDEVANFVPTVASLINRLIEPEEFRQCERMIRNQYLKHGAFLTDREKDDHIYRTLWAMDDGTPICVRAELRKLNSIKVPMADKKLVGFVVCDPAGQQICTLRTLPWRVVNLRELAYAVRNLFQGHFPHELLGHRLATAWAAAGGSGNLPQTLFLDELPDGSQLAIRFAEVMIENDEEDGLRHAKATILIDDTAVALKDLLPPMLRKISTEALDLESMESFVDMEDAYSTETHRDWLFKRIQRYDYLESFQSHYAGKAGIIPAMLPDGERVEVFHTGDYSADGAAIYGLCRGRREGRWSSIVWAYGDQLRGVGIKQLPEEPDWSLEWYAFDPNVPVGILSRHVLDNARRWADPASLTGRKDAQGHDVFVDDEQREAMYQKACQELEQSLRYATENPASVKYGYYHAAADRAHGDLSPIAIYLPAFFSALAKTSGDPDAFFALRVAKDAGRIRYEVPTILPPAYVDRTMSVLEETSLAA